MHTCDEHCIEGAIDALNVDRAAAIEALTLIGECPVCGVSRGPACPSCGGHGYHAEGCPEADAREHPAM